MNLQRAWMLAVGMLLCGMSGCGPKTEQEQAIAEIKKLGGKVYGANAVDLSGTQVTDAGVADLQKALPKCRINH
jgi:hypothetical protein